jgi:SpoVK/Ycf46/Vps4 family AAA+-type ATPase
MLPLMYRIDISLIVSRYVGETEKNLAKVFDRAESKDWILFFDEADALFGKRTNVNSANDRFANQEVAYLLQRIEDHNGTVILASNLKDNIDKAFLRRFQSVIYFPVPDADERFLLWKNAFPEAMQPATDVDLQTLAEKNVLSGGSIVNVVRYCCLKAVKNKAAFITAKDIEDGIRRELQKEGKII